MREVNSLGHSFMTEFQKELEHGVKETRKKYGGWRCTGEMAPLFCTHTWKKQPQVCLTYRPRDVHRDVAIRGHCDDSGLKSNAKVGPGWGLFLQPLWDPEHCPARSLGPAKCFSQYQPAQQPLTAGKKSVHFPWGEGARGAEWWATRVDTPPFPKSHEDRCHVSQDAAAPPASPATCSHALLSDLHLMLSLTQYLAAALLCF